MQYRKLMGFSKGSFIITLPKNWIEKNNLKKGDTIGIEENQDALMFHAGGKEQKKEEKTIIINANDKNLIRLKSEIVSAYLNNYNTIELFSENIGEDAPAIKDILRNLSGMEIVEQTGKRIVAKDLIDVKSISIQSIARRMDIITRSMMDDALLCIGGKCNANSLLDRDTDVNRLYYLGFRVIKNTMQDPALMSSMKTNSWKISTDRRILSRIEEIADRQKRIARLISETGYELKALEEFKKLSEDVKQRYTDAMKAYYNDDKQLAYEIEITTQAFIDRCDEFLKKTTKEACEHCKKSLGSNAKSVAKKGIKSEFISGFPGDIVVSTAKLVDYTRSTITFIRYIARAILNMD
jgi:phosphate uptake regulator